jgi:hypothetical protein
MFARRGDGMGKEGKGRTLSLLLVELVGCGIGLAGGLGVRHGD